MDVNAEAPHEFLGMLQLLNIDELRNLAGRAGWTDFPSDADLEPAFAWLAANTAAVFPAALSLPALLELCRQARADVEAMKEASRYTAFTEPGAEGTKEWAATRAAFRVSALSVQGCRVDEIDSDKPGAPKVAALVYYCADGDTMQDIATKFGLSLECLHEINTSFVPRLPKTLRGITRFKPATGTPVALEPDFPSEELQLAVQEGRANPSRLVLPPDLLPTQPPGTQQGMQQQVVQSQGMQQQGMPQQGMQQQGMQQPGMQQPGMQQPGMQQPGMQQQGMQQQDMQQQGMQQQGMHQLGMQQPGMPQQGMQQQGMQQQGMQQTGMQQQGVQQQGVQQQGMQQLGMQQQGVQQQGMQQQGVPQPGMQQPGMQQPGMQQPGMQQPGMQQPGMQQQDMQQPGMQQQSMQQQGMQ